MEDVPVVLARQSGNGFGASLSSARRRQINTHRRAYDARENQSGRSFIWHEGVVLAEAL